MQPLQRFPPHCSAELLQIQRSLISTGRRMVLPILLEFNRAEMCPDSRWEEIRPPLQNLIAITQTRWRLYIRPRPTIFSLFATSILRYLNRQQSSDALAPTCFWIGDWAR